MSGMFFESRMLMTPPETWSEFVTCMRPPGTEGQYASTFREPFDVYKGADYYRRIWGCEPLSPIMIADREHKARAGQPGGDKRLAPKNVAGKDCSWEIAYDVWPGVKKRQEGNCYQTDKLEQCCGDASCVGLLYNSDQNSQ